MNPNEVLDRARQGLARLREGLPKRSCLDRLRARGVRWVPEVDGIRTVAEAEGFFLDDAFSGSRMFTPRVVLIADTGESDDALVSLLHGLVDQSLVSANDVLLVAGDHGCVDYKRTEAFVAITFDAAMALNEKRDRAQVLKIIQGAKSSVDDARLLTGIEHAVASNLMLLVLREAKGERYPLVAPGHFLYRLYPELESVGIPIEFDDDPNLARACVEQAKALLARGAFWTDPGAAAAGLAEYFSTTIQRVDEHFAPTIMQSASMGRVYQILGVSDYLAGNLVATLQQNGVPYLAIAPRSLPERTSTGLHVVRHATVNDGDLALAAPAAPPEPEPEEPTLSTLEPLVERAPATDEFAVAAPRTPPAPPAAPPAPAPAPPQHQTASWERKEAGAKGGLKFKRVKIAGAPEAAPPAPPPPPPEPEPPPPPPPPVLETPPPIFSLPPPPPGVVSDKREATKVDEAQPGWKAEPPPPPKVERPAPPPPPPTPPPPPKVERITPTPPPKAVPPPARPAAAAMPQAPPESVATRVTPSIPPPAPPPVSAKPAPAEVGAEAEAMGEAGGMTFLDETLHESPRGIVRAAMDEFLRRPLAVRLVAPNAPEARRDALVARARLLERARGPGIPVVLGVPHSADGEVGVALPRYRGETLLRARSRSRGAMVAPFATFSVRAWRHAAEQLIGAFARIHAAGVVHAGLHPARVLWGEEDGMVLLGWGLAGEAGATIAVDRSLYPAQGKEGEPALARPAGLPGVSGFAAPEWLEGTVAKYSPALDVHAVAATIWHLWTGGAPGAEGDDLPPTPAALLRAALDPDPARRPADAGVFRRRWLAQFGD